MIDPAGRLAEVARVESLVWPLIWFQRGGGWIVWSCFRLPFFLPLLCLVEMEDWAGERIGSAAVERALQRQPFSPPLG